MKKIEKVATAYEILVVICAVLMVIGIALSRTHIKDTDLETNLKVLLVDNCNCCVQCENCESYWNVLFAEVKEWKYCPMCGGKIKRKGEKI